ncbi:RHS repeat domain-containing protein [Zobellia laminariae]|uniref:RHS repeat domain-containing protein n=1 Tax=Zobellia laminariae TaxID=248906 RepID=UPI0026F41D0F|nr:RHS repeat-associated core domain-containing protein [Zobellia laminariae]WKX76202.1 RHS repeat-associated core domain-containing protein [Zobellia laminariae]
MLSKDKEEPLDNLITWVFDEATFKPTAKIIDGEQFSIITDYLGTPVEMYNAQGARTWAVEYDIYGKVRKLVEGSLEDCPFRYQGQYEDSKTGLYYNRFRYYSAKEGLYLSQDPIKFLSGEPNFYAYVNDTNLYIDVLGLSKGSGTLGRNLSKAGMEHGMNPFTRGNFQAHHVIPHEVWVDNPQFFEDIGLGGAKDKAANGVFLPKNANVAQQGGFDYYHRGSHADINADMSTRVNGVKHQFNAGEISASQARKKISVIQKVERKRLSSRKEKMPIRCS